MSTKFAIRNALLDSFKNYLIDEPLPETVNIKKPLLKTYAWPHDRRFRFKVELDYAHRLAVSLMAAAADKEKCLITCSDHTFTLTQLYKKVHIDLQSGNSGAFWFRDYPTSRDKAIERKYESTRRTIKIDDLHLPVFFRQMVHDVTSFYDSIPEEWKPSSEFSTQVYWILRKG